MENFHKDRLEEDYPACADKIRLLGHFLLPSGPEEIPDPVGASQELYDKVIDLIDKALDNLVNLIDNIKERYYYNRKVIALGADHRGFKYKEKVRQFLESKGFKVLDCGTASEESCDHPDFAFQVAERVSFGLADKGVLLCSSGHGMLISANKVLGLRSCHLTRNMPKFPHHNNANVITFGADYMQPESINSILITA